MKLIIKCDALATLNGISAGESIEVADKKGVPTDIYWRNRLKDAAIDGCVEVKSATKAKAKPVEKD